MEALNQIFELFHVKHDLNTENKFCGYMDGILDKNQFVNLTAIVEPKEFIQKHYIDSLLCCTSDEFQNAKHIIDVGTGGGFPGVPLAILFPEKNFILIDSLNKRIKIINELCASLDIRNVTAIHGRAEELARKEGFRETFDLCVSRAVANMSTLSEYCLPFVKKGGSFIAYKGPDCEEEIKNAKKAISMLGGKLDRIEGMKIENVPFDHKLIYISKIKNTVSKYPRKAGTPSKEPIS